MVYSLYVFNLNFDVFPILDMLSMCSTHLILYDIFTLIIYYEEEEL